jgi:uncharacterized protein with ParB-like and HNH nuclease domain
MSSIEIKATQHRIQQVFSDFAFSIPLYQRPYAWNTEQAGELLEDLITSLGDSKEPIDDVNPYFLGSIVLIKEKEDKPDAQVVDGQQRLTTLTILLAVMRTLLQPPHAYALTKLLEESDPFDDSANRYRLILAKRDTDFFKQYIQDENGISKLKDLSSAALSDSRKNIKENALLFLNKLCNFTNEERLRLAHFVIKRCFLVVVSTLDLDSAYQIFSVLNDRGLDLSLSDILKAEVIGKIADCEKEAYAKKWDDIQEDLGRERFQYLFTHIRMIYRKSKPKESILKEFRLYVQPTNNPKNFIDEILCPYANSYFDINRVNYRHHQCADKINKLFGWLKQLDNSDWIPPAILYLSQQYNNPDELLRFFTALERLAAGIIIQRVNINERIERYGKLLFAIESGANLYADDSPLQLTTEERRNIVKVLNDDLYLIQKIRLFVLLRLDAALSDGEATYEFPTITVEHVLPQNPASDSVWVSSFTDRERERYVHCLGNLVLLSRRKNSEAKNYDFQKKKEKYFTTKAGVSPFALTTQVLQENEWTSAVIERRQQNLIGVLKQVWRL